MSDITPEQAREARVAEIRERAEQATPGPWSECGASGGKCSCGLVWCRSLDALVHDRPSAGTGPVSDRARQDSTFIAHARDDVPWLLEQLTQSTARETELRAEVERLERNAVMAIMELRESARLGTVSGGTLERVTQILNAKETV